MSIHQLDLFEYSWNSDWVLTSGGRIQQWVKWLITSTLVNRWDVSFYFDDAFISAIDSWKWKCSLTFQFQNRNYMFHWDFSIIMKSKGRKVEFNEIAFSDEFNTRKIESSAFWEKLQTILSQIQIFLFQNVVK